MVFPLKHVFLYHIQVLNRSVRVMKVPNLLLSTDIENSSLKYKPEGKRPLGRPRRRWEDNIKMDLLEVGGGGDWMDLAQDRDRWRALVNTVMNFRVP